MATDPPPQRLAFRLSQLGTVAAARFVQHLAPLGLTPAQAGTLRLLALEPGLSQRALAARLGAVPSRVVVLVDSLEGLGLVTRQRSERDRRNHELHLTDEGRAMLARLRAVAEAHEDGMVGALTEAERRQLARLLGKLGRAHGLDPEVHPGQARA